MTAVASAGSTRQARQGAQGQSCRAKKSLAQEQAASAKQYAQAHRMRLAGLANMCAALEQLAGTAFLDDAHYGIDAVLHRRPARGYLEDSSIAPFNNVAKPSLHITQNTDGCSAKISFYFAWQNPIDFLVVLNCSADVIAIGHVKKTADDGSSPAAPPRSNCGPSHRLRRSLDSSSRARGPTSTPSPPRAAASSTSAPSATGTFPRRRISPPRTSRSRATGSSCSRWRCCRLFDRRRQHRCRFRQREPLGHLPGAEHRAADAARPQRRNRCSSPDPSPP